jgi:hypothetical protein
MIRTRLPKADSARQADMARQATLNGRVDFVGPGHFDIG